MPFRTSHGHVIRVINHQTGFVRSLAVDRTIKAKKPGKRMSKTGNIYWETRKNRSDLRERL